MANLGLNIFGNNLWLSFSASLPCQMFLNRVDGSICPWEETPQKPSACFPAVHCPAGQRARWTGMPWAARHRAHTASSAQIDRTSLCPLTTCDLFLFLVHLPAQQTLFSCFVESSFELWLCCFVIFNVTSMSYFCYCHLCLWFWFDILVSVNMKQGNPLNVHTVMSLFEKDAALLQQQPRQLLGLDCFNNPITHMLTYSRWYQQNIKIVSEMQSDLQDITNGAGTQIEAKSTNRTLLFCFTIKICWWPPASCWIKQSIHKNIEMNSYKET